ncbi:MAG: ribonuclease H-like domain-containing protein [Dehalococcoidia bacterium]
MADSTVLRNRLRAALNQPLRDGPAPRIESVTELVDLSVLGGHWFQSPNGPGYVVESVYEVGHEHGRIPLHRALDVDTRRLAGQIKDERLGECAPCDFLYVDTETTGLGGAGSLVFLAGVARFDGSLLRLRQYLLPSPAYEGGLLGGLAEELATAAALVSYNGKSFDVPLLESRYVLARQEAGWRGLPHLDLLHPNRRLFRGEFDSHRLVRMEVELLGFERDDDCPSAEVPAMCFRFQRTSDPTHILPVLRHNAWDILSLVALAAHLAAVCDGLEQPLQAARAAEYTGDMASAVTHYERALDGELARALRLEAMERLARCLRKAERYEESARWWRALVAEPRQRRLTPYVELAKIAEHKLRDRAEALAAVQEARDLVRRGLVMPGVPGSETGVDALERRWARLLTPQSPIRKNRVPLPASRGEGE